MGENERNYEAFQIFEQIHALDENSKDDIKENLKENLEKHLEVESTMPLSGDKNGDMYYEIEYDSCPMPGVGKFVLKSSKVEAPQKDEIRETFNRMRDIARENRQLRYHSRFYDKRVQEENSRIFYKQGIFMADFEDAYEKTVPYSSYFPDYQMMGYDQLRTYFTWRTKVRQGNITDISLSYAFLYIYELLNNIGVKDSQDGLNKLMLFWDVFRFYDKTIDKYVLKWLKDYHIYYELPHSFYEFITENNLEEHYPKLASMDDNFDLFCSISKYDIRKSVFYNDYEDEIRKCFYHVMDKLKNVFGECGIDLEKFIFQPAKNMSVWIPFREALFYSHFRQSDRRVVLSEKEIYVCSGNSWTFNTTITTDSGKRLIGYCLKQMESTLRKVENYKYKLSADMGMLSPMMIEELEKSGISLEITITRATMEFHREANKTVVRVDREALDRIRQEALVTQEKLIVPEQETEGEIKESVRKEAGENIEECIRKKVNKGIQNDIRKEIENEKQGEIGKEDTTDASQDNFITDVWGGLKIALSEIETKALSILLHGNGDIRKFADQQNIMLEVLFDGINEKAMDCVGDSLLDGEFAVYEDYLEQVRRMVEGI